VKEAVPVKEDSLQMNSRKGGLNCCRMECDMVKDKREAWERDVEKMRQILAAQGCPLYIFHIFHCRWCFMWQ